MSLRRKAGRERKAAIEATLDYSFHHGRPRIVINCSFSDTMDVRELTSLAKQVQLSYTQARDSNSKAQLHIMSLHSQNPVIHSLEKQGMKSWKLHLHEESVWDVFATEARPARFDHPQREPPTAIPKLDCRSHREISAALFYPKP